MDEAFPRHNRGSVFFEEAVDQPSDGKPALAFVNATGPNIKNARVQRSIRNFVMRDHGKARRRPARSAKEKTTTPVSVSVVPKLTVVPRASPEYYDSVQLVKAAHRLQCGFQGCGEPPSPASSAATQGESTGYCSRHLQQVAIINNNASGISRFSAGRIDPFVQYPIEMTPRVRRLVDHVFDDRYRKDIKFHRDAIFPLGMSGSISFHMVLSNLALYLRHAQPLEGAEEYEAGEELACQARVFNLVNDKISKREATTDDVISAVAALACQSHIVGQMKMFHMHMDALKTMIRLRGGIDTIDGNQVLRNSIFWLETNGYSTDDLVPYWPIPTKFISYRPVLPCQITLPYGAQKTSTTWRRLYPHQQDFLDIFDDTARFAIHLEVEEHRTSNHVYSDVVFAGNLVIGLVHRLLRSRSAIDTENPSTLFKEACRLALLLFLALIRRRFGIHPLVTVVLVQKLKSVLASDSADWGELSQLRLWIVGMGLLDVVEDPELSWLAGEWTRTSINQGVTTPAQAETLFRSIMWIESVHGAKFRDLHERLYGRGRMLAPKT